MQPRVGAGALCPWHRDMPGPLTVAFGSNLVLMMLVLRLRKSSLTKMVTLNHSICRTACFKLETVCSIHLQAIPDRNAICGLETSPGNDSRNLLDLGNSIMRLVLDRRQTRRLVLLPRTKCQKHLNSNTKARRSSYPISSRRGAFPGRSIPSQG